ncbi:MAG TPA: bifunctional oligoribonuclease/PAP phosphatase NrnA [Chthoniobacteraceae bacterium]|nr:bifunctional oligoribonuclease/PAP phosphatase NrnA [Chthoniobacteraceae bacterium]
MSTQVPLATIAQALRDHHRFLVMSHLRPDGDAIGCSVAMALCLKALGKEVTVWNHDGPLEKLSFLPGSDLVSFPPFGEKHDFEVAIALDTASRERLGRCLESIGNVGLWINLDHHISNNGYGDLAHIDPTSPATGQIVYELISSAGLPWDAAMAENLFVAISTDTGSFQYSNTTARTFEIAAHLVASGVDVGRVSEQLYQTYPRRRVELLRELLASMRFSCDGRAASFALSQEAATRLGVTPEDNEGLIDHIRAIDGVAVAVFFEELGPESVRVSMRSKDPRHNVSQICARFGGGGHTLAAGARVSKNLSTTQAEVLDAICHAIHQS